MAFQKCFQEMAELLNAEYGGDFSHSTGFSSYYEQAKRVFLAKDLDFSDAKCLLQRLGMYHCNSGLMRHDYKEYFYQNVDEESLKSWFSMYDNLELLAEKIVISNETIHQKTEILISLGNCTAEIQATIVRIMHKIRPRDSVDQDTMILQRANELQMWHYLSTIYEKSFLEFVDTKIPCSAKVETKALLQLQLAWATEKANSHKRRFFSETYKLFIENESNNEPDPILRDYLQEVNNAMFKIRIRRAAFYH